MVKLPNILLVKDTIDLLGFFSTPHSLYFKAVIINRFLVSVSTVIANLVMEDIEQRALASVPNSLFLETFR